MTGPLAAPIVIPIVAGILLVIWLTMVYHADSHPYWRGRRPTTEQGLTGRLPGQELGAGPGPADRATGLRPAGPSPGPRPVAILRPVVPGQRLPGMPRRQPVPAAAPESAATQESAATMPAATQEPRPVAVLRPVVPGQRRPRAAERPSAARTPRQR